ncbi:MAG: S8 family serine peptidase [Propionibacteriaceae bacterium]|nr:S8 family serine peptidase [Propionibacteriaceae bacterium]
MTAHTPTACRLRIVAALAGIATLLSPLVPAQATPYTRPAEQALLPGKVPAEGDEEEQAECSPDVPRLVDETPAAFSLLGIEKAWDHSDGNVLVAVVDSGVAAGNAHLTAAVGPGLDLTGGAGEGRVDSFGHGTAIAGQIAARSVEGSGVKGLAPKAMILPVKTYVTDAEDADPALRPNDLLNAQGISWAADQGAKIIVVAQSSYGDSPELRAAVKHATSQGALIVASAGNVPTEKEQEQTDPAQRPDPNAPRFPAAYPEVLSVTAVDANGAPADSVLHGDHIDVAAPGGQVLTTYLDAGDCILAGEAPTTSYATGYVGGVAALVAAARPGETPEDWKYRIVATAFRPSRSQRDKYVGWGIVAPAEALNFINDGSMPGPPNPRFPMPEAQEPPRMTPPDHSQDLRPTRATVLAIVVGTGALLALATLLISRLRDLRRRRP